MSRPLRILQRAQNDVDEIFNWLVRRSIRGAISWYVAFGHAIGRIQESPENYSRAPEGEILHSELRQAFFKTRRGRRYRIIFQFDDQTIVVLRVRGPGQAPLRRRDV
jgi:plasmid stabilization system protein ParE